MSDRDTSTTRNQAQELDRKKRETMLYQLQRLMHERVMHAPIFEPASLHGVGPLYFAVPYEDMRLRKQ